MSKPFEQPKWFSDLKNRGGNQQGFAAGPAPKASVEDRVTALEKLLELHGIRPK